jgi:hypothetical protein
MKGLGSTRCNWICIEDPQLDLLDQNSSYFFNSSISFVVILVEGALEINQDVLVAKEEAARNNGGTADSLLNV